MVLCLTYLFSFASGDVGVADGCGRHMAEVRVCVESEIIY